MVEDGQPHSAWAVRAEGLVEMVERAVLDRTVAEVRLLYLHHPLAERLDSS